jgi:hypothetical protein
MAAADDSPQGLSAASQAQEIGVTTKIARYGSALRRWLGQGMPVRTDEEVARIYGEMCQPCEYFSTAKKNCKICGCRLSRGGIAVTNKIRMGTEHCPKGRW